MESNQKMLQSEDTFKQNTLMKLQNYRSQNHQLEVQLNQNDKTQIGLTLKLFQHQVAGKSPKLATLDGKFILKKFGLKQYRFYTFMNSLSINDPLHSLTYFMPQYHGEITLQKPLRTYLTQEPNHSDPNYQQWIDHIMKKVYLINAHKEFIVLQNVILKFQQPNVLDIKLGTLNPSGPKLQTQSKWDRRRFFLIHGFKTIFTSTKQKKSQGLETIFLSKYSFIDTVKSNQDFKEHLGLFFYDGQRIRQKLLKKVIQKIRELILCLKCLHSWKLYSSSVCVFYDSKNQDNFSVKLIDFGKSYCTESYQVEDDSIVIGLENIHQDLMQVLAQGTILNLKVKKLKQKYLKQKITIIPEKKKEKHNQQKMRCIDPLQYVVG